jgi:glycosyltransferase involved in cell wall biosynthesis
MRNAKLSYSLTRHPSQRKVAAIYQEIIREQYELIGDSSQADIVVIHHEPWRYQTSYAIHPCLIDKYVIGICVSHANDIPDAWKRSLKLVQEVWSCSDYCCEVLSRYHPNVVKVPYVVERDTTTTNEARQCIRRLIGHDPDNVYFFTIAPLAEPRKNIAALVDSFARVRAQMPKARLVIKAGPDDQAAWGEQQQVILLPMILPHAYINALYELTDVYVSAHHAEAWGTTISDAMLFKKPVMATGYSGNMEYMDGDNSFLLSFHEDTVPADTRAVAVEGGMKWVTPDTASVEEKLVELYKNHNTAQTLEKVARAWQRIQLFNREGVARIIHERIDRALRLATAGAPLAETVEIG